MSCLFAATYPERSSALVLYGTYAKRADPEDEYPWCQTMEERREVAAEIERSWGVDADLERPEPPPAFAGECFRRPTSQRHSGTQSQEKYG